MPRKGETVVTHTPLQPLPLGKYQTFHVLSIEEYCPSAYVDGRPAKPRTHVNLRDLQGLNWTWTTKEDSADLAALRCAIAHEVSLRHTPLAPEIVMLRGDVLCVLTCPPVGEGGDGTVRWQWMPRNTPKVVEPPRAKTVKPDTDGTLLDFFGSDAGH